MASRGWFSRLAGLAVLLAVGQFLAVWVAAMHFYPGGNEWDVHAMGYSFWRNTFSDLGKAVAANGQPNPFWSGVFNASMVVVFLGFVPLWLALPTLFARARKIGAAVVILGMMSAIGGVLVGLLPAGQSAGHAVAIGIGSIPGLAALLLACAGMICCRARWMAAFSIGLLLVGLVPFWQYVRCFWLGWEWKPVAPASQKVAILYGLAWMAGIGLAIRGRANYRTP